VSNVHVTYIGLHDAFAAPWLVNEEPPPAAAGVTVHKLRAPYHAIGVGTPDVALLCHPGFDNHLHLWHPTMGKLFDMGVPVIVAGHSNFHAFSHDAAAQDVTLAAFGAHFVQRMVWNAFCQAYYDETKGSLLAPFGRDHEHCNLAAISVVRGGNLQPLSEVDAFLDCLSYLLLPLHGLPSWFLPGGVPHRTLSSTSTSHVWHQHRGQRRAAWWRT